MKNIYTLLTILLSIILSNTIYAQGFDKAKMDKLFAAIQQYDQGMGSLSIFKDGKEVYQKSIGYEVTPNVKATADTKYMIGSISKTYTATMIMIAIEQKKLSLETTLDKFFPNITNAKKITIRQLLKHRSGIKNIVETFEAWQTQPINRKNLVARIQKAGIDFEPDAKFTYSNSGYILLTYILEDVFKKDFESLLKKLIAKPLGLQNTYIPVALGTKPHEAKSYQHLGKWNLAPETNPKVPLGAGAIISTPKEVNIFLHALFTGKLVKMSTVEEMKKDKSYGFALFRVPFYEKQGIGHTGGIDGFQSNGFYFEKEKVSITYLSNGVRLPINDILVGVLSIYFGKEYTIPDMKVSDFKVSEKTLDTYLGIYTSPKLPIDLTITRKGTQLIGQGTGQPQFPLEAISKHKFGLKSIGLELVFDPANKKMTFTQGGQTVEMTKK